MDNGNRETRERERHPSAILLLAALLALSWILWSGLYKPLVLILGFFSCILSVYLARRMGFFRHAGLFYIAPRLPGYWWWLLKEIVVSSIHVARVVLKPDMPISPTLVELEAETDSEVGQVILGNSITLSPGTVTLDMEEGHLLVHCLTRKSAVELQQGEANKRAASLGAD